jgi:hypothetical protein
MSLQERPYPELEIPQAQAPGPGGPEGRDLGRVRREAEALLRAGDEAVSRGLSGDSEGFLAAGRQQGGQ